MDKITENHLDAWVDWYAINEEQAAIVKSKILRILAEHPTLPDEGWSWPDILKLAEDI